MQEVFAVELNSSRAVTKRRREIRVYKVFLLRTIGFDDFPKSEISFNLRHGIKERSWCSTFVSNCERDKSVSLC